MYKIKYSNKFKKDLKRALKRGCDISLLEKVIELLQNTGKLPPQYNAHILSGKYDGLWECYLKPDGYLFGNKMILN